MEPEEHAPDPDDPRPAEPRISRRTVLIGAVAAAGVIGVAGVAATVLSGSDGGDQTQVTEPPPDTKAPGGRPKVDYPSDVPRVPQDPSTGVAGWPMDPAGAQLVQAPV